MLSDRKNYEYIPPEGGWGYLILCGMITPIICGIGSVPSFGLLFGDFLNSIGAKADTVAIITSFFFVAFNFAGLITNILSKRFSKRSIALSGSFMYILGSFLTIFVRTKLELFLSYGLLQGSGFGLMTPISFDVFNSYFVKRRSFMMSVSSLLMGLCLTLYPILVQFAKSSFGLRGCLALIAAINMHTFVAMLIMHPFEWHSERVVRVVNQEHFHYTDAETKMLQANSDEENSKMESEMVLMPINVDTMQDMRNMVSPQVTKNNRACDLWSRMVEFLDLNLMKDPMYVNIALGVAFTTYSDTAFISFQPTYLLDRNYSNDDVASVIASGLGADLLSRLLYSLAAAFIDLKSRDMFLFGAIFMLVARIAFMYVSEFMEVMVINGFIGFFRAWIYITPTLVFAEHLPLRFSSAFGLYMFIQGMTIIIFGIAISWIHNTFESYTVTFYVAHAMLLLCIVPWIIEIVLVRSKKCIKGNVQSK